MTSAPRCSPTCTPTARCASTTWPRPSAPHARTSRRPWTGSSARAISSDRATGWSPTPPRTPRPASTSRASAATPSRSRSTTTSSSFPAFVERAQEHVEREAAAHADDIWWVLEPTLLVEDAGALREEPIPDGGLDAVEAPAAVALHVDLALGGEPAPAIALAARGRLAPATVYALVERTDAGTPRLGPWQPAPELAAEVAEALRMPRP